MLSPWERVRLSVCVGGFRIHCWLYLPTFPSLPGGFLPPKPPRGSQAVDRADPPVAFSPRNLLSLSFSAQRHRE